MALLELRVSGLAVIDRVCLDLAPGFNALTGETGSGKSVCLTGLRLVLGERVDGDPVRPGCDRATVTAVIDDIPAGLGERLAALGVPPDEYLTLSRDVPREGRGRCTVNGALVSLAVLRECGERLVEVTGQGESHRLFRPGRQRALLDAFAGAGVSAARSEAAAAVSAGRAAAPRLATARAHQSRDAVGLEEARRVVAELEPLGLAAGEDAELESECARLRHAAALAGAAGALADACGGTDDAQGAADLIAAAVDVARGVGDIDRALDALAAEAAESVARLRELALEGRRLGADMVVDEARLGAVEERLDVLDRVRRRHGGSLEAALGVLHLAAERVAAATASGSADTAVALAAAARVEASARCTELSRRRVRAGAELEAAVHDRLRSLGLRHARFRAVVRQRDDADGLEFEGRRVACGTDGIDEVEFRLAADRNGVPLPLSQGSSGGELSRLALALRAVAADRDECPTLVLDEVDAGVGGETAARVGELIAAIGAGRQVIAVTHRAEIAARASAHIVVTKREVRHRATAGAARVEGVARVGEVARLLSGRTTPAALTRAAELLEEGDPGIASAPRTIAPG